MSSRPRLLQRTVSGSVVQPQLGSVLMSEASVSSGGLGNCVR